MVYVPANISFEDNYQELRLGGQVPFSGLNLRDMDTSIGDGQSPYMINVNLDDGGKPTKRRGQESVFASKGAGGINGLYKETYKECIVYAWGTGLYALKDGVEKTLKSGLANVQGYFYTFNDVLFYKNGTDFLKWDGTFLDNTAVSVLDNAYIPTITLGRAPTGGGTANEGRNLIQPGFKDSFSGNASATAYTLSFSGLDSTTVTAVVNGSIIAEGSGLTVNRTTGVVTFSSAPSTGTNNVVITAFKTIAGDKEKIIKAVRCTLFGGGTNDSCVRKDGIISPDNRL